MRTVSDRDGMIRGMTPTLRAGVYGFATVEGDAAALDPVATFREDEGLSVVAPLDRLEAAGVVPAFEARWISLEVNSDLGGVGLTAAVSAALTEAGIPCNMVAATRHDHVFVPADRAEEAVERLLRLQAEGR